jgi:hypothetical protein
MGRQPASDPDHPARRRVGAAALALLIVAGAWWSWGGRHEGDPRRGTAQSTRLQPSAAQEPTRTEVPRVIGLHAAFAKRMLASTHLVPGRVRLEPSDQPWGSVIYQSVSPGTSVLAGTTVDLVLAKGSVPRPCRLYWCATGA